MHPMQRGTSEGKCIQENLIEKEGKDFKLVMQLSEHFIQP